jgi:hypothetical protein
MAKLAVLAAPVIRVAVVEVLHEVRERDVQVERGIDRGIREELEVLLDVGITNPVTTIDDELLVDVSVVAINATSLVNILATVVREAINVLEAVNAHEEALTIQATSEDRVSHVVVAEDGSSGQVLRGTKVGGNGLSKVNVQVVTEQVGVLGGLSLHDRAIHEDTFIHEDTLLIAILVSSDLATSLPFTIGIGAIDLSQNSARASEVALVVARNSGVDNALRNDSAVNTRQSQAFNAQRRASSISGDKGLATVERIQVAIRIVGEAFEDAITTVNKVSNIALAVGLEVSGLDVQSGRVGNKIPTINSRAERSREVKEETSGRIRARSIVHVEAKLIAVVDESLRALLGVGAVATSRVRETKLAPASSVFATVAWIRIAILVVMETTILASQANLAVRASTRLSGQRTTLARNEVESLKVQVLLLGVARVLRPVRAIEGTRSSTANGSVEARFSVVESNFATVSPVTIVIVAEKRVARNSALSNGSRQVAD